MIRRVVQNRGGLHNRITRRIHLKPFTLQETEAYFDYKKIRLNRYHVAQIYMIMGGIPHYLKEVRAGKSPVQNIDDICFSEEGLLREMLYRLTDEYSLFYLHFIENKRLQERGMWKRLSQTSVYQSWSRYAFKSLCLKHISQIKKALEIGGIYSETASFYFGGNEDLSGTQIDLLIDRNDGVINLCELKFYNDSFMLTKNYAKKLRLKRRVFTTISKTKKQIFISLITTFGLSPNKHSIGLIDNSLDIDVLFEPL